MYAKITAALGVLMLICVISVITYNEISQEHITVLVQLNQDADPISVLGQIPGQITNVRSIDKSKNEYEIKMVSKQSSGKLLEILRSFATIKNAKVQDKY